MPITRLRFKNKTDMRSVEETVALAIVGASCIHGDAAVRLSCSYLVSNEKRTAVVRWEEDVGGCVIRLVIGFCAKEYGSTAFAVERVERSESPFGDGKITDPEWGLNQTYNPPPKCPDPNNPQCDCPECKEVG